MTCGTLQFKKPAYWVLTVSLMLLLNVAYAGELKGKVIKVVDGDTIHILTPQKETVKVRLAEIDAPERKQAYGNASRLALSDICAGQSAILTNTSKDRYGRTVARVRCGRTDANAEMLRRGMAWVYTAYLKDSSLKTIELEARSEKRGLWKDPNSIAPWKFRKMKK